MPLISEPFRSVSIFLSYSREDAALQDVLVKQLSPLRRQGIITQWYDCDISAGSDWQNFMAHRTDTPRPSRFISGLWQSASKLLAQNTLKSLRVSTVWHIFMVYRESKPRPSRSISEL